MTGRIITRRHALVFEGEDATRLYQAVILRSALGLMAKGIKPRAGYTQKKAFAQVTSFTGITYKRGDWCRAHADLTEWISAAKSRVTVEVGE